MSEFHHFLPITVRYSDIDAQGHVNNTRFATYFEIGRLTYLQHLDLWDGKDFLKLGVIVADMHISFLKPIYLGQEIEVATRISHIGNKSIKFEFQIQDQHSGEILSTAETINVAYDYVTEQTLPVSKEWREAISQFENTTF
jgi:acyl-CoA thioester hydrolase